MGEKVLLNFNDDDYRKAEVLKKKELIDPSNSHDMFKAMVYSMLSSSDTYPNQMKMYNSLFGQNLPKKNSSISGLLKAGISDISTIVRDKAKSSNLKELFHWWEEFGEGTHARINEDISYDRTAEFDIRNKIAKEAPGISYKCSSLFMNMCGYANVVVLDLWAMRALVSDPQYRPKIKSYYYIPTDEAKRKRQGKRRAKHTHLGHGVYLDHGISSKSEYLPYESMFIDMAKKNGFDPFDYKQLIWVKNSTFGKKIKLDQLALEY